MKSIRCSVAAACLGVILTTQTFAQVGPIEPIIIASSKPGKTLAEIPNMSEDFVVPVEVTVAADGSVQDVVVSPSSGNATADETAIKFMREKRFLPAIDEIGHPIEATALGNVEVKSKSRHKVLKANMKPPNSHNEVTRVRKMTCKDFLWEVDRLRGEGASTDVSREIMPWVSLRLYMADKKITPEAEPKYLAKWPQALGDAEKACTAAPATLYLEALAPVLDAQGAG